MNETIRRHKQGITRSPLERDTALDGGIQFCPTGAESATVVDGRGTETDSIAEGATPVGDWGNPPVDEEGNPTLGHLDFQ